MGSGNCAFWAPATFDIGDDNIAFVIDPEGRPGGQDPQRRRGLPDPGHHPLVTLGVTEDHRALHDTARTLGRGPRPAGRGPGDAGRRRPTPCRRSGTSWPSSAGWACTSPRSTAARASAWPSWPSSSRSWAGRWRRGRSCPPCSRSAVVDRLGHDRRRGAALLPGPGRRLDAGAVAFASADPATGVDRPSSVPPRPRVVVVPIGDDWWALLADGSDGRRSTRASTRPAGWPTVRLDGEPTGHRLGPERPPRPGPGPGRHAAGRRVGGRLGLVRRHGVGLRQGSRAVRPSDRPVPGRQAPLRRHARRARAGPGRGLGRRPGRRRRRGGAGRGRGRGHRPRGLRRAAPRAASRCTAASGSRGSTTPTCSCAGPWPPASSRAARRPGTTWSSNGRGAGPGGR